MADVKISELVEATLPLDGTEDLPIVKDGVTVRCSTQDIADLSALGYTAENVLNKSTDGVFSANSDTLYPSQKAVKTYVNSLGNPITVKISLIAGDILALGSTPYPLIAAQGAGTLIRVIACTGRLNYGTAAYSGGALRIAHAAGGSYIVTNSTFYTGGADAISYMTLSTSVSLAATAVNSPLQLDAASAVTLGDGTLDIYVSYVVITV